MAFWADEALAQAMARHVPERSEAHCAATQKAPGALRSRGN